jgi:hypothetical protein
MRWRVLMNSLERTGARDTLERLSLAMEQIGPIIAFVLLGPSALGLAALSGYAGYWLPQAERVMTFDVLRLLLLLACGFCLVGPLLMPSMERTSAVRLLLLPISRGTLYVAQASIALADPWILLVVAVLLGLPVGLAAAGAPGGAAIALAGGMLFLLLLVGLSTVATLLLHLVVRDRRRGELVTLLFMLMLPALSMAPALLTSQRVERVGRGERLDRERTGEQYYSLLPSELLVRAIRSSARRDTRDAAVPLLALGATAAALHGFGVVIFGRLLSSPGSTTRRQRASGGGWGMRIPGVSRGATAVAQAQLRMALRTPRGRSTLLSPLAVFAMLAIVMRRNAGAMEVGFIPVANGLALATFGSAVCVLSVLPFAMNQFAIDRAGLTLALLSPLRDRDLLVGKAIGNGLIVAGPSLLSIAAAYALFPVGPVALWLTLPPALLATYAIAVPGAAALSALFPRPVDLNSIGRGSNAHGAASLLGLLVFAAGALPCVLLAVLAIAVLDRPSLTPILMCGWCLAALALSRGLLGAVTVLFEKRRENLAIVAG